MVFGWHALAIGPLIYASVNVNVSFKIDEMFQMTTYHSFT